MRRRTALQNVRVLTRTRKERIMAHAVASLTTNLIEDTRLAVYIGGFSLGVWCEGSIPVALDPEHLPFLLRSPVNHACDIEVDISWVDRLTLPAAAPSFSSGGLWSAYTSRKGTEFYFSSPVVDVHNRPCSRCSRTSRR